MGEYEYKFRGYQCHDSDIGQIVGEAMSQTIGQSDNQACQSTSTFSSIDPSIQIQRKLPQLYKETLDEMPKSQIEKRKKNMESISHGVILTTKSPPFENTELYFFKYFPFVQNTAGRN